MDWQPRLRMGYLPGEITMSSNPYGPLDRTVQKTHEWLKELTQITGRSDEHKSLQMLRAVLHVLRDRLTVDEAAHLGAQLPMLVRGFYYENWKPAEKPSRIRSRSEFLQAVRYELNNNPEIDPAQAIDSVLVLLERKITQGELEDVKQMMPPEMREFWPKAA